MMAEKKGNIYPHVPSAPQHQFQQDPSQTHHRPPPPSYEESQRWNPQPMYAPQGGNFYPAMGGSNPPPYAGVHQPMHYAQQQGMAVYAPNYPQYAINYNAQPQMMPNTMLSSSTNAPAVTFDAGARFKGKGAGSINVPPPPPGCAPTPEQIAALNGQPVMLKKKKNSFF